MKRFLCWCLWRSWLHSLMCRVWRKMFLSSAVIFCWVKSLHCSSVACARVFCMSRWLDSSLPAWCPASVLPGWFLSLIVGQTLSSLSLISYQILVSGILGIQPQLVSTHLILQPTHSHWCLSSWLSDLVSSSGYSGGGWSTQQRRGREWWSFLQESDSSESWQWRHGRACGQSPWRRGVFPEPRHPPWVQHNDHPRTKLYIPLTTAKTLFMIIRIAVITLHGKYFLSTKCYIQHWPGPSLGLVNVMMNNPIF